MADIVVDNSELIEQHGGQRGFRTYYGVGTFNSTDANGDLPVLGMNTILDVHLTPIGTVAADENLSVNVAPTAGRFALTSGRINILRTGAVKTSALKFCFTIRGR